MALVIADRVKVTTTTTGTGDLSLASASTGFQDFTAVGDGNTTYYAISSALGSEWEVGLGTYTAAGPTLSRDTILDSSNSGSAVNFSAGTKDVYVVAPADKSVLKDAAGNFNEDTTGNAATATILATARTIAGQSFDGSANISIAPTDLTGVTASAAELNLIDGSSAGTIVNSKAVVYGSSGEVNATTLQLGGTSLTASATELNYVDGVTSSIQTQLDSMVEKAGDTMTGFLTLSADPTSALHAATKEYVDTIASAGIHYHAPVRVESPSNLNATYDNGTSGVGATLTNAGTNAAISIDGIALSSADRVLVYNQTNAAHNGVYTVTTVGDGATAWVLTRATDADSYGVSDPDALGEGDAFFVSEGDTGAGELYVMNTSGTITFGTTDITFTQIAATAVYSAGSGLDLTGTTFSHTDTSSQASVNNSGNTFIQDVTLDGFGHVTGLTSASVTVNDGTLTMATSGTGLSGSASFTANDSDNVTFTVTSNATNANTGSTIVARDASGNFSAGTITAALTGNVTGNCSGSSGSTTGNAATATKLATARSIGLTGDVSGSANFDGSAGISITATVADDSHNHVISNVDGLQTALDAKQGLDADLTAIAGLSSADGNFIVGSATGWVAESGATARTSLGLGSLATLSTVDASTITDNSVGAAELNVTGNGTASQFLRSDGDGTFTWATPTDTNTTYTAGTGLTLSTTTFSVNYGTTTGTACQGNDSRLSNSRQCNNSFDNAATARSNLGLGSLATLSTVNAATITDNSVGAAELNVTGNGTASQFLRSDGDGTFTWATPTDTNTTYSAGSGLDLTGTTFSVETDLRDGITYVGLDTSDYIYFVNNTRIDFFVNGSNEFRMESDGDFHADGDVIAYSTTTASDERLKENIEVVADSLAKVESLRGVEFTWKRDGQASAGVIAQEVQEVLPQAVKQVTGMNGEDHLTVNYGALTSILIEAVKELSTKVKELEAKVG